MNLTLWLILSPKETTLEKDGVQYVAMKPICENIGLDWDGQRKRIDRKEVLKSVTVMMTATGID